MACRVLRGLRAPLLYRAPIISSVVISVRAVQPFITSVRRPGTGQRAREAGAKYEYEYEYEYTTPTKFFPVLLLR